MNPEPGGPVTHLRYDGVAPPNLVAAVTLKSFHQRHGDSGLRPHLAQILDFPAVASVRQVHSADVVVARSAGQQSAADGLATDQPGLLLTVVTADCLPLFLWSLDGACIALLHAGWRGSAAGIARRGVELLVARFGADPGRLGALLGPSICPACYEVGPEVAAAFHPEDSRPGRGDRRHLDLRAANRRRLLEAGVLEKNIVADDLCTRCRSDLLCSYRAAGPDCGRLVAALGLRRPSFFMGYTE
ncbi:MAG: laccase domain-containing protein [Candidatus Zixiibacteriota bacterium]|nr:MAG: laccase domain-containing protein [candidate division Zixibacteria bacterium]